MTDQDRARRWERLSRLLEPIHDKAAATARNLCRTSGDGDDLYQEAVLRAFEKLHTLRDEARFRSWFFAVLLSIHRSRHRRSFWKRFLPLDSVPPEAPSLAGEDGRDREDALLAARRAAWALSRIPAEQREAVVLHDLQGFTMGEVAAMQGVTEAAVKSRVLRGRDKLRRTYRRLGRDDPGSGTAGMETADGAAATAGQPAPARIRLHLSHETTITTGRRS